MRKVKEKVIFILKLSVLLSLLVLCSLVIDYILDDDLYYGNSAFDNFMSIYSFYFQVVSQLLLIISTGYLLFNKKRDKRVIIVKGGLWLATLILFSLWNIICFYWNI